MEPYSIVAGLVIVLAIILIGLVTGAEVALASVNRGRIRELKDAGASQAILVDSLLTESPRFLVALMLAKTAGFLVAGGAFISLPGIRTAAPALLLGAIVLCWLGFSLAQILGRALAIRNVEQTALVAAPFVQIISLLFQPLSAFLRKIGAWVRGDIETVSEESIFLSEDGLRFLIDLGEGEGVIQEDERQMIASIFEMGDTVVREVMVPRIDIISIGADAELHEVLDTIIQAGHSRIPVYEESIDRIMGFLYAKDLLKCYRDHQAQVSIRELLRPVYFVPESKKVNELFQEIQKKRVHIAIVVDEYGGTAGLVTIEDLLEEIVGDIQDEYDHESPEVQELARDTFIFNARVNLDEAADLLAIPLPEEAADTLGGFIFSQLGHVPETGEALIYDGWRFTVLSVEARRIRQVRAELAPHTETDLADESARDQAQTDPSNPSLSSYQIS